MKQGKKLLCTILTVLMMATVPVTAYASELPFIDVTEDDFFYPGVNYFYSIGVVQGKTPNIFDPAAEISRAEFVTLLFRAMGNFAGCENEVHNAKYEPVFSDVPDGYFYSIPVTWAAKAGIVKGYDNGLFTGTDPISREQIATMLYRADQYYSTKGQDFFMFTPTGTELQKFADGGLVSPFAITAMQYAITSYIISGREMNGGLVLAPLDTASRAEAITMLQRWE